jgi:PAS domain-containing protein
LKSFAGFIGTLPHPAAIYWGEELILVQNSAWKKVVGSNGADQQGKAQVEQLSDIALTAIRTVMHGSVRRNLAPSHLLNGNPRDGRDYSLLLSPIDSGDGPLFSGAVAQLFYRGDMEATKPEGKPSFYRQQSHESQKGTLDDLPLDEHPFFQRFAAMLPTGLAILNHKAEAIFVNRQFYDLTTHREDDKSFRSWPQTIHPDDYDRVMKLYQDAFISGKQLTCEFRTQGHENHPWRLLLLTPLGDDNLRHASLQDYGGFICAIIDISPNKANELAQEKAAREAKERKEQQERFIDMISHEIRNPLSAVLHCAEDIMETVEAGSDGSGKSTISTAGMIEAAETISLCVSHQKSLVDDILSFSKLDASMLSLSPKSVQPKLQLADSLKMFQPELRKQCMAFEYLVDHSYDDIHVDFVQADLVRISQVLVYVFFFHVETTRSSLFRNLVSNSIKFTSKKDGEKKISVAVGASIERPTSYPPNVVFFDTDDLGYRMDATNTSEWGRH